MNIAKNERQSVTIPEYVLHPNDVDIIRAISERMKINIIEYAQLAPYLYARDHQWETIDPRTNALSKLKHNQP